MPTDNDYSKLLLYLENEDVKKVQPYVKSCNKSITKKLQQVKNEDQKVLEESSQLFSDVIFKSQNTSKGFDVYKFESLMRSKLIDDYKRSENYERPYISVSELYRCIRQTYYTRMKMPINVKKQFGFSYLYLIQKIGNEIHDIIQNLYDFTESEKTIISERYQVKGRVDAIKDGFLYELKTIDPSKFSGKYIEEHYYQGLIYAYILNSEYNYNIHTITIIYILRDLKKIVPFDLPIDNSLAKSFLDRAQILSSALKTKIPPEPIASNLEQCKWCSYKKYCKEDKTEIGQPFLKKSKQPIKDQPKDSVFLL